MAKVQIKISPDNDSESPRTWDNLGTIVAWHRRYSLSDTDALRDLKSLIESKSNVDTDDWEPIQYQNWLEKNDCLVLPVYMFDHSGITINTTGFSCPWDSGQVGFIYMSREKVRREYGVKRVSAKLRERVLGYLKGEIGTYAQYLEGEIYGFQVQKVRKDGTVKKEIDACWGFYGGDIKTNGMLDYIDEKHHNAPVVADW